MSNINQGFCVIYQDGLKIDVTNQNNHLQNHTNAMFLVSNMTITYLLLTIGSTISVLSLFHEL